MSFWGGAILLTIFVVSVVAVYLSGKELLIGSESISDEMPSSSSTFAIMVENDDGDYEEYTESETWPSGMVFNSNMSFCQDKDGAIIEESLTYSNGYATLTSSDTSYCWLYFRNYGTTATLASITVILSSGTTYTCTSTSCTYTAGSGDTSFTILAATEDGSYASFYFSNDTSSVYSDVALSDSYTLTAGSTTTGTVKVTSEDGSTSKTYTINVKKSDSDSTLSSITASSGTWGTECSGSTTTCTLSVSNSVTSVTLTPNPTSETATASEVTVSSLSVGTNTQTITVTAEDGTTTTYTVNIIRASSSSSGGSSSSSGSSSSCSSYTCTTTYTTYAVFSPSGNTVTASSPTHCPDLSSASGFVSQTCSTMTTCTCND